MPQDAFQVDPVINDRGDIVGVEAHSLNHEGMGRDGQTIGWKNDLYEDRFGNTHHRFEDVSLADPTSQQTHFDTDDYAQNLLASDPSIGQALDIIYSSKLAQEMMGMDKIAAYDKAVAEGDLEAIHAGLETIKSVAQQAMELEGLEQQETEQEDYDNDAQVDEWFNNITDEQLDDYVEGIQNINYTQEDYNWMDQVQSQVEDNSIHSDILAMGKSIATGRMDVNDAINAVCDKWGEAKATLAFFEIQRLYNGQ